MRIYLAGLEGNHDLIEKDSKPYILESFFYSEKGNASEMLRHYGDYMIDSGAYSFMSGQKGTEWADYVDRYADWLLANKVEKFFELDLDAIMDFSQVMALRTRLETRVGRQSIPVWHKSRGKEQFIQDCKDYPYVAIGGIVVREITPQEHKYFPWFINTAHEHGAKIHGLGYTSVTGLKKYHFDSVDSTRWNCARFGRVEYFTGRSMKAVDKRKDGFRVKNAQDVIRFTFNEWVKFQKYADNHL